MPNTIDDVLNGDAQFAVVCGDATAILKSIPSGTISLTYCDPPYGLSSQNTADVVACLTAWLAGTVYTHHGPGFMGNDWDAFVPGPEAWREVYRVLKPGAYCVAYSSTRTVDLLGIAMRLGGLEPRNGWAWITGQGFPKNLDVGKALDKMAGATREVGPVDPARAGRLANQRGKYMTDAGWSAGNRTITVDPPATDAAKQWDGYGTDVKPSYEPIAVTRKPLDGTVASNVLTHGTGALNINAARLSTTDAQGRFPSSVALIHDEGCTQVGTTRVKGNRTDTRPDGDGGRKDKSQWRFRPTGATKRGFSDEDGLETTDVWDCTPTCAVRVLGEQSGQLTSGKGAVIRTLKPRATLGAESRPIGTEIPSYGDTGTGARFFYQGKASAKDRLAYLTCSPDCTAHNTVAPAKQADPDDPCPVCNNTRTVYLHPTVKPYDLAAYHARLLSLPLHTRPVAIVPFCGTGVEAKALLDVGFRVIAVDIDPRHVAMTLYRLLGEQPVPDPSTLTMDDLLGLT